VRDFWVFLVILCKDWMAFVTGLGALALSILAALRTWFGIPGDIPPWIFWASAVTCFFICAYRVWHKELQAHRTTRARLSAVLEICEGTKPSGDHHRIRVRNVSSRTVRFSAKLVSISQHVDYPIPAFLQLDGTQPPHRENEIEGGGLAYVNVLVCPSDGRLALLIASFPVEAPVPIGMQECKMRIRVFPLSPQDGKGDDRCFRLKPQGDGRVMLIDMGRPLDVEPEHSVWEF
jgi:hypothetical protein